MLEWTKNVGHAGRYDFFLVYSWKVFLYLSWVLHLRTFLMSSIRDIGVEEWVWILLYSKSFVIFKNTFTFGRWCHYAFTVSVSWCYVITQEWWFRVHFIHAENFTLSTISNLTHIAPWSEDDLRQLSNCGQWFLFLKETKWLSVQENHDNQPQ